MTTEQEQVVQRIVLEGFGTGDLDVIDLLVAQRVTEHQYGLSGDRERLKQAIAGLRQAFPDDTAYDGEKVWGHFRARGTHVGPFRGHGPTGRAFCSSQRSRPDEISHWDTPQLGVWIGPQACPHRRPPARLLVYRSSSRAVVTACVDG